MIIMDYRIAGIIIPDLLHIMHNITSSLTIFPWLAGWSKNSLGKTLDVCKGEKTLFLKIFFLISYESEA
jgi:hypothetical protein